MLQNNGPINIGLNVGPSSTWQIDGCNARASMSCDSRLLHMPINIPGVIVNNFYSMSTECNRNLSSERIAIVRMWILVICWSG